MVYVDDIEITPNPVQTGGMLTVEVTLHEEYESAKKYKNRYPYRYGEKGENK